MFFIQSALLALSAELQMCTDLTYVSFTLFVKVQTHVRVGKAQDMNIHQFVMIVFHFHVTFNVWVFFFCRRALYCI